VADLRAALGHALEPAYRVEREVRPVGGCRLFVAVDRSAGADLLVKVLPAALSLSVDAARFAAELRGLAGSLVHHGLVAPRSGGRAGPFVYHTRAFVQGTTLRAWLTRYGELPLRRTVDVLRDVLDALAHAHAAGVSHGDLKPENVLLTDGHTLVADTGVFGAVQRSCDAGQGSGEGEGRGNGEGAPTAALCVSDYLAPERRSGAGQAGPRDDVFAVGVILHEMLTGRAPGAQGEPLEELRAVPTWLGDLGRRCRAVDPAERWADAAAALAGGVWPAGGAS
jgi:eukaryotic-like serine/threonine-protein kinase